MSKELDKKREEIKKLYIMQATDIEVASFLGVNFKTLSKWLNKNETNKMLKEEGLASGKLSLRRRMFQNATEGNNTQMQIHLSKNYLGMSDKQEIQQTNYNHDVTEVTDEELKEIIGFNTK